MHGGPERRRATRHRGDIEQSQMKNSQACDGDYASLQDQPGMQRLPEKQGREARHVCSGCERIEGKPSSRISALDSRTLKNATVAIEVWNGIQAKAPSGGSSGNAEQIQVEQSCHACSNCVDELNEH